MTPIVQTPDALVIDTSQIKLTVPGQWEQHPPTSSGCIYCGQSENRQIIIDGFLYTDTPDVNDQIAVVNDLLQHYLETERKVTDGKIDLHSTEAVAENGVVQATYFGLHPSAGRVVFCRLIGDNEKAFGIYWEAFGFSSQPDLKSLGTEFLTIANSCTLK